MRLLRTWATGNALVGACLLAVLLTSVGCREDAKAVLGTEKAFTLYGVFNPTADTQFARVYPIEERLSLTRPEPLAVSVMSTNLQEGQQRVWQDSIIQEPDGRYAHVFWSPFRAENRATYRLTVEGETGSLSSAEATVPPPAKLVLRTPRVNEGVVLLPVFLDGAVPRLLNVEAVYRIQYDASSEFEADFAIPYGEGGFVRQVEEGWMITLSLSRDHQTLIKRLQDGEDTEYNSDYGLGLVSITLHLAAVNEAWNPPGGTFDLNTLAQPGTFSNVENGFGFVGAGFRLQETWRPNGEVLQAAGFR